MDFNYNHLIAFYKVAKCGGYSKASEKYNISQPSLSASVSKLQCRLNVKLLVKNNNILELTKEGEYYFEIASKIIDLIENPNSKIFLKIASKPPVYYNFLPKFKYYFENSIENSEIELIVSEPNDLKNILLLEKADIIVNTHPILENNEKYKNRKIGDKIECQFFCNSSLYSLINKDTVTLEEIKEYQILYNNNDITDSDINEDENFVGVQRDVYIKQSIINGKGIGLLSPLLLQNEIKENKVHILKIKEIEDIFMNIYITYNKEKDKCISKYIDIINMFFKLIKED